VLADVAVPPLPTTVVAGAPPLPAAEGAGGAMAVLVAVGGVGAEPAAPPVAVV